MDELLLPLTVEPLQEGGYLATSPVWDDLLAQGRTIAETLEIAQDVARRLIESYLERGDPLPEFLTKHTKPAAAIFSLQIAVPIAA